MPSIRLGFRVVRQHEIDNVEKVHAEMAFERCCWQAQGHRRGDGDGCGRCGNRARCQTTVTRSGSAPVCNPNRCCLNVSTQREPSCGRFFQPEGSNQECGRQKRVSHEQISRFLKFGDDVTSPDVRQKIRMKVRQARP